MRTRLEWQRETARIEDLFGATADLYYEFWGDFFHLAIFEDGGHDFAAAFEATHRRYFEALRAPEAQRILELGCGGGAFAAWLADHTAAEVLGIDISDVQISRALTRRSRSNLRFRKHDIMELGALHEGSFDAVVCMDTAVYLPDRGAALRAIAGVLRPGGRLLLVDWSRPEKLNELQEELVLEPFCRAWGIAGLETPSGYERHLAHAGFRLISRDDLSERVRPNWRRGYEAANRAIAELSLARIARIAQLSSRYGADGYRLAKDQYHAAVFAMVAADAGALLYTYFLADV